MIGDSMGFLVNDCKDLMGIAATKRRRLDDLSDTMRDMVSSLKKETDKNLRQVSSELNMSRDKQASAYIKMQHKESDAILKKQREAHTGFYYFMKEQKQRIHNEAPYMKEIEVIAFLQAKWTALSAEDKLSFEMQGGDA